MTTVAAHSDLFNHRKLSDAELNHYQEHGYLIVGRTLTEAGLEQMRREAMQAWEAEKWPFDPSKTWLQNALLTDIHHRAPTIRRYYFSGPLVDVATQLIGPNIKGAGSQLTFKMRGNDKPFAWHQDNNYGELEPYNAVSCLTALDDVDRENGCLWLIPGSHRTGQLMALTPEEKKAKKSVELEVDESKAMPIETPAGHCLLFHCHMLHKSEENRSKGRDRRILFLRYADADAVEVYNQRRPRLGRLLHGATRFEEVRDFEAHLPLR